ncbi:hypothetical protein ACJX0J_021788, partial [Zea mays]
SVYWVVHRKYIGITNAILKKFGSVRARFAMFILKVFKGDISCAIVYLMGTWQGLTLGHIFKGTQGT